MQPLGDVEVALCAGEVQWSLSLNVSGVDRGARAVQPLSDVEVTPRAGVVQRCQSVTVGGIERGARAAQPLRDVELALTACKVQGRLGHARAAKRLLRAAKTALALKKVIQPKAVTRDAVTKIWRAGETFTSFD